MCIFAKFRTPASVRAVQMSLLSDDTAFFTLVRQGILLSRGETEGPTRAFSSFPETGGNSQDKIVSSVQYPPVPRDGAQTPFGSARVEIA